MIVIQSISFAYNPCWYKLYGKMISQKVNISFNNDSAKYLKNKEKLLNILSSALSTFRQLKNVFSFCIRCNNEPSYKYGKKKRQIWKILMYFTNKNRSKSYLVPLLLKGMQQTRFCVFVFQIFILHSFLKSEASTLCSIKLQMKKCRN